MLPFNEMEELGVCAQSKSHTNLPSLWRTTSFTMLTDFLISQMGIMATLNSRCSRKIVSRLLNTDYRSRFGGFDDLLEKKSPGSGTLEKPLTSYLMSHAHKMLRFCPLNSHTEGCYHLPFASSVHISTKSKMLHKRCLNLRVWSIILVIQI